MILLIYRPNFSSWVNADIFIASEETGTVTVTNIKGEYVLHLSKGEYDVVFSHKGFEKYTAKINLKESIVQLVELSYKNNIVKRNSIFAFLPVFNKGKEEKLTMKD